MSLDPESAQEAIALARHALQHGQRSEARKWAAQAAALAPEQEDAWLILASVASPRASLVYLERALQINPTSQRARMGMHWAVQRLRAIPPPRQRSSPPAISSAQRRQNQGKELHQRHLHGKSQRRSTLHRGILHLLPWALVPLVFLVAWLLFFGFPGLPQSVSLSQPLALAQEAIFQAIYSPTPSSTLTSTPTSTPTVTLTATPIFTPTPTDTPTSTPTDTPTTTPTETPPPSPTPTLPPVPPTPQPTSTTVIILPAGVGENDPWIDVDISGQTAYALQGYHLLRSFLISTGLRYTPTVLGTYRIYVKYRYADMYGDDYYLPAVPYTMYFYEGYGLHGTYWHENFGHRMSHGCINLRTEDAAWIFNWAPVGTVVNIHK